MKFCHSNFSAQHSRSQSGATMLEFALALPIFFLLVFGFFDISRYWQTRAALQQVAWEGMNDFAIDRDIKKKGSHAGEDVTAFNEAFERITKKMQARAAELAVGVVGGSVEDIQVLATLPDSASKFLQEPVSINVSARYRGVFLPIDVDVLATTSGYVENFRTTSEPLITDCDGNPYDASTPPGSYPYGSYCPCEKGEHSFADEDGSCYCSKEYTGWDNGMTSTVDASGKASCSCPAGTSPISALKESEYYPAGSHSNEYFQGVDNQYKICCPEGTKEKCPSGQNHYNFAAYKYECGCNCGPGAAADGETCKCTDVNKEYVLSGGWGQCACKNMQQASQACTAAGGQFDFNACKCNCQPGQGGTRSVQNGSCACDPPTTPGPTGSTFNSTTCSYQCPDNQAPVNGACACTGNYQPNGSGGCTCPLTAASCPPAGDPDTHKVFDSATCSCKCQSTATATGPGGSCTCPNGKDWGGNGAAADACGCTATDAQCPAAGQSRGSNCGCNCPSGFVATGSAGSQKCCPSNSVLSGGNCACPTGTHLAPDGKSCTCDAGYASVNGTCCPVCGRGFTATVSGGSCSCSTCVYPKVESKPGYCSPRDCRPGCQFREDGTCDVNSCPPG